MQRGAVIAWVLLASLCAGGCARSHRHAPLASNHAASRDSHQELAAIAADVVAGLWQRVEADEPLTPEFVGLLCEWARRQFLHADAAARNAGERHAAAERYGSRLRAVYDELDVTLSEDPDQLRMQKLLTEYYLRESGGFVATGATRAEPAFPLRPRVDIARDLFQAIEKRIEMDEPITPEFLRLFCGASRRWCVAEMSEAGSPEARRRAASEHLRRISPFFPIPAVFYSLDGPGRLNDYEYCVAEAKLWAEEAGSGQSQREADLRRAMDDAARRRFASLRKRREAEEPMTPEFVEELCDWSEKVCRAEEATRGDRERETTPTAREDHLRRMRDLHADLKKRLDEKDADVTRIQVSQAAYFLREAELGLEAPGR